MKLSDLEQNKTVKVLLYGDSGTGKTCFASGFPRPLHYCDFDGKVTSALNFLHSQDQDADGITVDQYLSSKATSPGHDFNVDMGKLHKLALSGDFPYETIVIDSLTTFSDLMMNYLMKMNPGVKRVVTQGVQIPSQQDYGIARIFFKETISKIISFPCNVVFTAHIQIKEDKVTGELLRVPMIAGKLATELPIFFEEVYRTFVRDDKYMAQTRADRKFNCRTQIPGLPAEIELDYENINPN